MSNVYVALPAPAANAAGAAVDVSTFGAAKTITVSGNGGLFEPFVTIEMSNQVTPTKWAPVWTFFSPSEKTVIVAAIWMRARVSNYRTGPAPSVDVGSNLDTSDRASLVAPAGNGSGAGVSTTTLGLLKTIQVCGPFRGALNVEVSEDAGTSYNTLTTFFSPGQKTIEATAEFMRVSRNGVPQVNPGLPTVEICAVNPSGGGSSLVIEDEGVPLAGAPHTTLNFVGAGVTAADGGGGVATVTIPGGGAAAANYQPVNYVATGGETDFMVTIPLAMANDTYGLTWAPAGMANIPGNLDLPNILAGDRTTTQFRVTCTALTAGDKLTFVVFAS